MPKISIISINYNNADGLYKTIQSVINQTYIDIEYIVIDGGSEDNSKAVIEAQEQSIHYWVSETDSGIYNAMNKGIKASSGDYLLFINSGDILANNHVIEQAVDFGLDLDLVYGDIIFVGKEESRDWIVEDVLSFDIFYKSTIPHPGTFIRKTLFEKIGLYSEQYKIVSDWEFFLLATCKYNCSYKHINLFITRFDTDGISADPKNYEMLLSERKNVLEHHFPFFVKDYERYHQLKEDLRKVRHYAKAQLFFKSIFKK